MGVLHLGNRVAGVNAFKIYDVLYEDEKKEGRINLPPKWTHAKFLEELVYDLLIPEQSQKHVDWLRWMEHNELSSSVNITCSVPEEYEDTDLSCRSGVREYLRKKKTTSITRERMEGSFFQNRLDGLWHDWVHALEKSHCQLCYYKYTHEMDERQQEAWKYKHQNRWNIIRCLTCNVNLCCECDHEFHG